MPFLVYAEGGRAASATPLWRNRSSAHVSIPTSPHATVMSITGTESDAGQPIYERRACAAQARRRADRWAAACTTRLSRVPPAQGDWCRTRARSSCPAAARRAQGPSWAGRRPCRSRGPARCCASPASPAGGPGPCRTRRPPRGCALTHRHTLSPRVLRATRHLPPKLVAASWHAQISWWYHTILQSLLSCPLPLSPSPR